MLSVTLSQLKAEGFADPQHFAMAVAKYIGDMRAHQKTEGLAAPLSLPVVEHAVRRDQFPIDAGKPDDFIADYQVIDDTPPPPTLEQKKADLVAQVSTDGMARMEQIVPALKAKLLSIQYSQALAVAEKDRTPDQRKAVADGVARDKQMQAVSLHWATLESQIHDLTDATIDAWKAAPFPK